MKASAAIIPGRIGLVLSAGGLRGAAHLGVVQELLRRGIRLDILVGVSAGAVIAAYYAAVGLTVEEMIDEASSFRGRHLVLHGLALRSPEFLRLWLEPYCGVIPARLRQLEAGRFDRLHHEIEGLGIVCHDRISKKPVYFATGMKTSASLSQTVRASAALPGLIPTRFLRAGQRDYLLTDGGISDPVPVEFARSQPLGAEKLIVSDCRRRGARPREGDAATVMIRPEIDEVGILHSPRGSLLRAVQKGREAVTSRVLEQIAGWMERSDDTPLGETGQRG